MLWIVAEAAADIIAELLLLINEAPGLLQC